MSDIAEIAAAQDGLVTAAQIAATGYSNSAVRHRARQGGPWTRVLPATYLVTGGGLSRRQRRTAAVLYTGEPCALTGVSALALHGVRAAQALETDEVHVLAPHRRRRLSREFVRVERTRYWPAVRTLGTWPVVDPARAVVDGCRQLHRASDVSALLAETVGDGYTTFDLVRQELRTAQRQRTALVREVLAILERGPASAAEVDLYRRWCESDLPDALWNADLVLPSGEFLARPDVYLPEVGVVFELDSLRHHYQRDEWELTMQRHTRMTARGLLVLHATPTRVRTEWESVCRDLLGAIGSRRGARRPDVVVHEMRRA